MHYPPTPSFGRVASRSEPSGPTTDPASGSARSSLGLLHECLRKTGEWEQQLPAAGPERETAGELRALVEDLIGEGHPSIIAMCKVRKLLCCVCRRLHASHELCDGQVLQPLDECLLLRELHS